MADRTRPRERGPAREPDDTARRWLARILAPVLFLLAATLLVVLVQRALDEEPAASTAANGVVTVEVSTSAVGDQPSPTETEAGARQFYRIKAGDTLEGIASQADTTVDRLLELNPGIDPLALTPGERIRVN